MLGQGRNEAPEVDYRSTVVIASLRTIAFVLTHAHSDVSCRSLKYDWYYFLVLTPNKAGLPLLPSISKRSLFVARASSL